MDLLVGTPQCPHLGYALQNGTPCCRADDPTRLACGQWAPNPQARGGGTNVIGLEANFCVVLGKDAVPVEALRLAAQEKARQARESRSSYRAPAKVTGRQAARTARTQEEDAEQPIVPTHTLRHEAARVAPNDRCPCGSGKKYKKCCSQR